VTTPGESLDIERQLDPPQIKSMLDVGVAQTVAYAKKVSPFYMRSLAGFTPVQSIADLQSLPITTKKQVSEFNEQFWCTRPESFVDLCTTSGTTGRPTLYPLTAPDLDRLGFNEYLCFKRAGMSAGDTAVLAVTIDKCFMAGLAYFQGLRQLGATAVRVGAGSPAMLLSMIQRLRPTVIISVPSFLKRVADYAHQQNFALEQTSVRKLICIGEPVRNADWTLAPAAEQIARAWNAQIFSTYGCTELACSLCECTAGQGGHLHPQLLHIEILDDNGSRVPDGQLGQLVATTIGVQAMPLIRFATGDITCMTNQRCACGLHTPRIGPIVGRKDQAMKIKGTMVYPAAVERALQTFEKVADYIMIATAPNALSDQLEVLIAWKGDASNARDAILEKLRGDLKVCPTVRLTTAQEIHALRDSSELRKVRVFLDRRNPTA
jgi:phenylacetate-CoA ligase